MPGVRPQQPSSKDNKPYNFVLLWRYQAPRLKEIYLTQGKIALVDDEDYERLNIYKWSVRLNRNSSYQDQYYARRTVHENNKTHSIYMHREVLNVSRESNLCVDHINPVATLDNRKNNLRKATKSQNNANARLRSDNKSGFRGVYRLSSGKWRVMIRHNNKRISVGTFADKIVASQKYYEKALELFGAFARLN